MASAKTVEDMLLCSDIDESAVNALVGSLESQLSQPGIPYPRTEGTSNSNIICSSYSDSSLRTLSSTQKHGALLGSLLDRGNGNVNKTFVGSQPLAMSPVPVMVSGTGPPSTGGFVNNAYAPSPQQGLTPAVSNSEIKVVYSVHSTSAIVQTPTTGVANTTHFVRNNLKLQNGSPSISSANTAIVMTSGGLIRNGPTVVCQNSATTLPQNVAQQPLPNPCTFQSTLQQQTLVSQATGAKVLPSTNPPALTVKDSNSQQAFLQVSNQQTATFQNANNTQPTVISTSKSVSAQGTPVSVMTPVMSNQHTVPGIQVVNVNPTRFNSSNIQRTLAPRVVISNQIRIAPQVIRHGVHVPIPGQNAIAIPSGLRGTIYVKTDNGQFQVLNIGAGMQSANASSPGTTAYRVQSVHPGTPGTVRTLVPQPVTIAPTSTSKSTPAMSSEAVKQKCRNFLATLMKLAAEQPKKVAANVKKLIQGLIDGVVLPEDFTTRLQKELNSSPQPCLVPFLKKSLPYLRHSLITKEVTIEGVNPPPPSAYMLPPYPTPAQPLNQSDHLRPVLTQPSTTTVVNSSVGSVLTAQLSQPTTVLPTQVLNAPKIVHPVTSQSVPRVTLPANMQPVIAKPVTSVSSMSTVFSHVKPSQVKPVMVKSATTKDKRIIPSVRDEDDINDVAAMGGVNLLEESQKILATNSELIGMQIRSCKDDNYFMGGTLQSRILQLARKSGLQDVSCDAIALISHAAQERIKNLVERLSIIAEHRTEHVKNEPTYEVTHDVRTQIKFLEELDRLEKKKHEEQEREILLRAAKSRSKLEDPEQLKLKQKAKEMQKAEIEEIRQREANATALHAIGPRKKLKTDVGGSGSSPLTSVSGISNALSKPMVRPRVKRVNFRDLLFVLEQERDPWLKNLLYKSSVK